jgi:hypothetical protein
MVLPPSEMNHIISQKIYFTSFFSLHPSLAHGSLLPAIGVYGRTFKGLIYFFDDPFRRPYLGCLFFWESGRQGGLKFLACGPDLAVRQAIARTSRENRLKISYSRLIKSGKMAFY